MRSLTRITYPRIHTNITPQMLDTFAHSRTGSFHASNTISSVYKKKQIPLKQIPKIVQHVSN